MSAACAPATATSPAAVPRRRLFTIFISTPYVVVSAGNGLSALNLREIYFTKNLHGDRRQATTKRYFEHSAVQFSAGCCRNNTSFKAAAGRWPTLSSADDLMH